MRTWNRVIILLIVALAAFLATLQAGQDNAAKPQQTAQRQLSGVRAASCLVRITIDPAIVPLDPATVRGLLYSSGVVVAAAREALQRDSMENTWEELIEMEWLNESLPRRSPTAASMDDEARLYDEQMMRELEKIYGQEYTKQMMNPGDARRGDKPEQPARSPAESPALRGRRPVASTRDPLASSRPAFAAGQSATIRLSVHLPDGVPPAAKEFLEAVISNLRSSLRYAYETYTNDLNEQIGQAQSQYNAAVSVLQGADDPAASALRERLDTVVDLSTWTPETPLAEAIQMLRKSVNPPLNIVALWHDLMDSLQVDPKTPIHIDGMPAVKLRTALDLLVKGMPSVEGTPMWKIEDDAIVIATATVLGEPSESPGQPRVEFDTQALAAQRIGLTNKLQELELSLAGQEARRRAIAEQIARMEHETQENLAKDEITSELMSLVKLSEQNFSNLRQQADAGRASTTDLAQATENLTRARIELAKRREELGKQAGGGQLEQLNGELGRMAIEGAEKEAQKGILTERLAQMQQELARASTFDPEAAQRRMSREEIDILARRIGELRVRAANLQSPMVTVIGAD